VRIEVVSGKMKWVARGLARVQKRSRPEHWRCCSIWSRSLSSYILENEVQGGIGDVFEHPILRGPSSCFEAVKEKVPQKVFELPCGNRIQALHDGVEAFPAIESAIDDAKEEVLFEMYWFESDKAGWRVAERLIAASKRGVSVRVVYDAFGCIEADRGVFDAMRDARCEVLEYNPIPPWRKSFSFDRMHRRDHRKMLVVDRKLVLTGGLNIANYWLPFEDGGEAWRDVVVKIEGPAVPAYAGIFERLVGPLRDGHHHDEEDDSCQETIHPTFWRLLFGMHDLRFGRIREEVRASVNKGRDAMTTTLLNRLRALPEGTLMLFPFRVRNIGEEVSPSTAWWSSQGRLRMNFEPRESRSNRSPIFRKSRPRDLFFEQVMPKWQKLGSNIQVITNDGLSDRNTIRRGYLRAIHAARERITIVNSYFVPCARIRSALYKAAERGVLVRIVVPGAKTDLRTVQLATHAMYDRMLMRGIELYEWLPTVLHSKVCIIDGEVATVGTYNIDYRSWYYNLELVTVVHDDEFASSLEARIQNDMIHHCEKVELSKWLSRPFLKRLSEQFWYRFRHHM